MELNREQIIKGLECCVKVGGYRDAQYCNECPLHEERCALELPRNALALINELTEENEELLDTIACLEIDLENARVNTVRKMQSELYEEFLKVAYCQKADEPNMKSQEVFAILDQIANELLENADDK